MKHTRTLTSKKQKGIAAVEAAMVFPLLLLFLFGAINYGFALYNKSIIVNASREAAREGVVVSVGGAPDQSKLNTIAAKIQAELSQPGRLVTFGVSPQPSVTLVSVDGGVNVSANITYSFKGVAAGLFAGQGFDAGMPIVANTKMRFE